MDVLGGVMLDDGTELKVVTGVDDHSRFCVAADLLSRATSRAVYEVFAASLRTHGVPDEVLTDNGKVFTGRFGTQNRRRSCSTAFAGRTESRTDSPHRVHRPRPARSSASTKAFARSSSPIAPSYRLKQHKRPLDAWAFDYNTERPHQAVEMATPADRFRLPGLAKDNLSVPTDTADDQTGHWVLRRVASNGIVSVDNQMFSVGNAYKGFSSMLSSMTPQFRSGARTTSSRPSLG
jgi:hypothetical protein